jgi:hypothetical protein
VGAPCGRLSHDRRISFSDYTFREAIGKDEDSHRIDKGFASRLGKFLLARSVVGLYSCLTGGCKNGHEGLLGMASQARKVGRRIPGAGTGAIRYEGGGGSMDASEFPGSRERKGESSKAEKLSSWRESGRVDVVLRKEALDRTRNELAAVAGWHKGLRT